MIADEPAVETIPALASLVLIADDVARIRKMIARAIEQSGFGVLQASCADEALSLLGCHHSISILLTDVHMPGSMNGIELVRRAHAEWPHLRFIVISGEFQPVAGDLPEGALFLAKPFGIRSIWQALQSLETFPARQQ